MILSFFNHAFLLSLIREKIIIKFSYLCIIMLSLLVLGCDKIQDGIVDTKTVNYKVVSITAPASYSTTTADSSITTSVQVQNNSTVGNVWCSVESLDETQSIYKHIDMLDDGNKQTDGDQVKGDGIYSCKFVMSIKLPNGKYQIQYFVEDNVRLSPDNLTKIGTQVFNYNNSQTNYAPVISNLVIPGTAERGTSFVFSVKVDDQNGLADISQVYFKLYRPNGSIVMNGTLDYFLMVDTGDANFGDQTAGDGIYSFKNSFGSTSQTGLWKFEFRAKDRSGLLSNLITSNLTVN
jgi:hypothetical protein